MKVLQFGKFYPPHVGGIERVIFDITEGLNARGVRCDVLCSNKCRRYSEEDERGYRVTRTRSHAILFSASISPQLASKLRKVEAGYDIIHVHLPDPMANLALLLARPRARVVLHWHNDVVRQRMLLRFYLPLQEWMLRRADAIIATSPNYIKGSPYLSRYEGKCSVVPVGVDRNRLVADDAVVAGIRERFSGKTIVFSIGRLSRYKGYNYLIEAAKALDERFVVLIAGLGPEEGRLRGQIAKAGLAGKVVMLGHVPQERIASYYRACDVFCLSSVSRNEGFGLVQIEAMLFEKPVVSTAIEGSGVTWANISGETGLVVEPRNPGALARAIERVCTDRDLYSKLACGGLRRASEEFTLEKMISGTVRVYQSLA
jgi:glycosyltransferase involved in cell wall biosynthesis